MKKYLLIIFNLAAILVLVLVLILPQYQRFQLLKTDFAQKEADLKARQDYNQTIADLKKELDKYGPEMEKISSAVPADPFFPSLLDYLQATASQGKLVIRKVALGQASLVLDNPAVEKRVISLEVAGFYPDFKNFIGELEKSSRLIQVETFSIAKPEKEIVFNFNVSLSVNFFSSVNNVSQ